MPKLSLVTLENGKQVVTGKCVVTKKEYTTPEFPPSAMDAYKNGAMIQDAFDMLKNEEREFIITGISPEGWNLTFGPEEAE